MTVRIWLAVLGSGFFLASPSTGNEVHCNPHTEIAMQHHGYGPWYCVKIAQTDGSALNPAWDHGSGNGQNDPPTKGNRSDSGTTGRYHGH